MGKTLVNGQPVVTPASEMKVSELKELAKVPEHDKLYSPKEARMLEDDEVVPTDEAQYGVVTDFEEG